MGRLRLLVIAGVALGVGGAVAVAGTIGFIGLVAPHLVRPLIGHDPARLLLPSALTGAALLLAADIAVRIIPSTTDIKVGVLTSIIGVPFFLYLIVARASRARRRCRMSGPRHAHCAECRRDAVGGRVVLDDISVSLSAGHLVALVGPERRRQNHAAPRPGGPGALDRDDRDRRRRACPSLPLRERARRFAYLPQGHVVHWPLPARDVVALGRYPHGATDPARLSPADEAGRDARDAGDRTWSNSPNAPSPNCPAASAAASRWRGCWPSKRPSMLADEPTASLDPRYQIDVMINLRNAADRGVLVLVVTHDLGLGRALCGHRDRAVGRASRGAGKTQLMRFRTRSWPTCSGSAPIVRTTGTRP